MGLFCDVCEKEPGTAYCFADRALMCSACDHRVHTANKLAKKHDRVSISTDTQSVPCDICQEEKAVMFCPEERAVTCRRCDIMIHTANEFTGKHRRSLLSTVTVGLNSLPPPNEGQPPAAGNVKAAGRSMKEQETSTSSGSPLGASTDGGTASDGPPSGSRSRSRRGKNANGKSGREGSGLGSSGQLLDNRLGAQAGGATLLNSGGQNGALQQSFANGNALSMPDIGRSPNGGLANDLRADLAPPRPQPSPFQFTPLPFQDSQSAQTALQQQQQPGGAGQPDGMFASSYPPGTGTSTIGAPGPSGFDVGARAQSTGMWRASSTNSGGMTLAAELLGVPLPDEYSAKDIDAAYMMDGDGDLDADLSALLEVPDLSSTDLASLGPSMTPSLLANSFNQGASGIGQADGVVPDMSQAGPSKRQRR